ncbi:hypothetical protein FRC06_000214 [Ceratobasidium sp. 370]|nr:hypothetical protein FRC06_000214 [Ceratobasidium sp. 370]
MIVSDNCITSGDIRAALTYYLPSSDGKSLYVKFPRPESPSLQVNYITDLQNVVIRDLRGLEKNFSLDANGFEFAVHETSEDFLDKDAIEKNYYAEIRQLVKEHTGAHQVFIITHRIRQSYETAVGIDSGNAHELPPAHSVHADRTPECVAAEVKKYLGEDGERLLQGRVRYINVWRPIGNAVHHEPLALADWQTSSDMSYVLPLHIETADDAFEVMVSRFNAKHTWYYLKHQYASPAENDTVSIFLRKIPATVQQKDYLGSIIINPGGPGGSGGGWAVTLGPALRFMVDGRYDIIGFDPRGVNMTLPPFNCYTTEAQGRHYMYKQTLLGVMYDSRGPRTLPAEIRAASERMFANKLDTLYKTVYLACQKHGNKKMLESASTALVVQDMEQIVKALGEDGLNFWGFSYGTILGSTFAAMRPHLVKRMILDGVSNAESYHKSTYQWGMDGMADSHKTLSGFLNSCADAGPDRCEFARSIDGTPTTPTSLRARLESLYNQLREQPMPVSGAGPGFLTASDAKLAVHMGLYVPKLWPSMAEDITAAEAGDPQPLYDRVYAEFAEILPEQADKNVFNRHMEKYVLPATTASVMCTDSEPVGWKTLDDQIEYTHQMGRISPIGEHWASWAGYCRHWKIKAIQRYDGPWSVAEGLNKTRFPILYASLDADLVTPLSAAQHMVKAFGNESATLLVQEGFGHGTFSSLSRCALNAFRNYFVKGQVPLPGTVCKLEPGHIFPEKNAKPAHSLSIEDQKLWKVLEQLSEVSLTLP